LHGAHDADRALIGGDCHYCPLKTRLTASLV